MEKYAYLQTGAGTPVTVALYFGPFELQQDIDAFVEKARDAFEKLGFDTSPMVISIVNQLPEGCAALSPGDLVTFLTL